MNGSNFFDALSQELRYAWRVLLKSPGFALPAILSLGLGIGANTAVFSIVYAVMLHPLPYPEPDQLLRVSSRAAAAENLSLDQLEFLTQSAKSFQSLAGYRSPFEDSLDSGARREWIKAMPVTSGFLETLHVPPASGRGVSSIDTRAGAPQSIVLSDNLFHRLFPGESNVSGRIVSMGRTRLTVAGVLPAGFWFPQPVDALVPLQPSGGAVDMGSNTFVLGRLKPGVDLKQARSELATLSETYNQSRRIASDTQQGFGATRYQEWLSGDVRLNLLLLTAGVGLLLLIACSNVAGLIVARLAARQREIALRLAVGSGSGRLIMQFTVENVLLGVAGAATGVVAGYWLLASLVTLIPFQLHSPGLIELNWPVLLFTIAIAGIAGLAFSFVSFTALSGINVHDTLKSGRGASGGVGGVRDKLRGSLVVGQVAMSVAFLVVASLLIQSLYFLHHERLGFKPEGIVTFWTPPSLERREKGADLRNFEARLAERLRAVPGVVSVASTNFLPLTSQNNYPTQRQGHPEQSIGGMEIRMISPEYFATMSIPVLRGRSFSPGDTSTALPVILVNETLAKRWWGQQGTPLGDRVQIGWMDGQRLPDLNEPAREVVGVVGDTKTVYLQQPPRPTVYIPSAQTSWMTGGTSWVVKAAPSPTLADQLRRAIWEIDPTQRMDSVRTMDEIVAATTSDSRFDAWLFGAFAALALLLCAVGVYGLLSFSVARRTTEIGIRMALGASRGAVLRQILNQGLVLIASGLAIGLVAAFAATRFLLKLLYGVHPTDALSFAAAILAMLLVGLAASYLPARRATQIEALAALRQD